MGRLNRKPHIAILLLALLATAAMTGLVSPTAGASGVRPASQTPTKGGTATVVGDFNLATVDPGSPSEATGSGSIYYYAIYDGLFTFNSHSQLQPDLATSWSFGRGGSTAIINLRKGVKFSDGTPFNADAVKWNIDRDADPANACACLQNMANVKSVAVSSPTRVSITLQHADASFFTVLASSSGNFIASPTAFQKEGAAAFGTKPVGAGPFEVQSLVAGSKLVLARYPGYWNGGSVHLDGINVVVDSESSSQYDALSAGNAQLMMFADPGSEQRALQNSQFKVLTQPATAWTAIQFNTLEPPFNSKIAREAVAAAIDPHALNKTIYDNTNVVSNSIFGKGEDLNIGGSVPGGPMFNQPARAASLVHQLGTPITFTIDALNSPTNLQVLTAIGSMLSRAGMKMQISTYPRSSYLPVLEQGQYQAFLSGDAGQIDPSAYAGAFFVYGGTFQKDLKDPTLARMVSATERKATAAGRIAGYRKVMSYVNQHEYFLPLWTTPTFDIATKSLQGAVVGPSLRLNNAWLTSTASDQAGK